MIPSEFLAEFHDFLADCEDDDMDMWTMIALVQAYCMLHVMQLNGPAREYLGRRVGEIAAQIDGRTVH